MSKMPDSFDYRLRENPQGWSEWEILDTTRAMNYLNKLINKIDGTKNVISYPWCKGNNSGIKIVPIEGEIEKITFKSTQTFLHQIAEGDSSDDTLDIKVETSDTTYHYYISHYPEK